jgi:hypothetical protein
MLKFCKYGTCGLLSGFLVLLHFIPILLIMLSVASRLGLRDKEHKNTVPVNGKDFGAFTLFCKLFCGGGRNNMLVHILSV